MDSRNSITSITSITGKMAQLPITEDEHKLILQFRKRIADMTFDEVENHDICMVAWLRAREHDLDKAEEMIRNSKTFLASKGYDTILSWEPPKHYDVCFPYELCGYDLDGFPVIIVPLCEWDTYARKELVAGRKEAVNKFVLQFAAKVMANVKARSNPAKNVLITKYNLIFDLKGLRLHHLTSPAIQELMFPNFRLCERNFPETLRFAYVVNAPKIFALVFPLIKSMLAAKTLKRVQVYDSNSDKWKHQLMKTVSEDELPEFYGGKKPDTLQKRVAFLKSMVSEETIGLGGISVDSLKEVTIKAGDKVILDYEVKEPNSTISWIFKTANYDIGFAILYGDNNNNEAVIPLKRCHAQEQVQEGSHACARPGKYTFIFDNTFSMFRSKTVHYLVVVENGDESQGERISA